MSTQPIASASASVAAIAARVADGNASRTTPNPSTQGTPGGGTIDALAGASASGSSALSKPIDATQIDQALTEVREAIAPVAQNLLFSIDDDTGRTIIKIIDRSTDEVIKQIPSEEILAIAKALDKLQGLLIKQDA
jgi:flagellar protein FlaG